MEYLQYPSDNSGANETVAVLNLVISGIPSIHRRTDTLHISQVGFKPCYKWNTFNTNQEITLGGNRMSFKPCYKWNTFNTLDLYKDIEFMAN